MATITGTFLAAGPIEVDQPEGSVTKYHKRKFYIESSSNPQWPNNPAFLLKGEQNVRLVSSLKKGELIEVQFAINGKFYNDKNGEKKHFNEIVATNVLLIQKQQIPTNHSSEPQSTSAPTTASSTEDDLPF